MRPENNKKFRTELNDAAESSSSSDEAVDIEFPVEGPIGRALNKFAKGLDDLEERIVCTLDEFGKDLVMLKNGQTRLQRHLKRISRKGVGPESSISKVKGSKQMFLLAPRGFRSFNVEKCNSIVKAHNERNRNNEVEFLTKNMAVAAQVSNDYS